MNKVDVEKALKVLGQDIQQRSPYKLPSTPTSQNSRTSTPRMEPLPVEYSPEMNPEDSEPQDD